MLWSVDSYQNRVSADQYRLTVPRARLSTHRSRVFFWSYPLTIYHFQMIASSSLFFPMIHIKYVVFISLWSRTIRILISNWPRTRKFSQFFLKYRRGRPFLRDGPSQKWWGGGGFSACTNFFFAHCLCRNLFFRWTPLHEFFFSDKYCLFLNSEILIHYLCFCAL